VLTLFGLPAGSDLHCPLMAATEGVSRKVKLPGIMDFMQDTQPLFFPSGELVAATVQFPMGSHYRAFYLPEVCGLPLGLVWPTTIASIKSLKSDYQHFVQVLEALQPALMSWFQTITQDPSPFMIPSTSFLKLYDKGFPAVKTGDFPDQIVDPLAFSPLQEMLHGYIWCLVCDQVLAIGTVQARRFFALYLAQGKMALNADSYFGAKLPDRFCPNFAYHIRVVNNWPIRPDPLKDLTKLHTVSLRAQAFNPVIFDLHIVVHPEISLRTWDQLSTERHRQTTPRFLSVTRGAAPLLGLGPLAASDIIPQVGVSTWAPPPVDLTQQAHSATTNFTSLNSDYPPPEYPRFGSLQPQLPPYLPTHHRQSLFIRYQPCTIPDQLALYSQLLVWQLSHRSPRRSWPSIIATGLKQPSLPLKAGTRHPQSSSIAVAFLFTMIPSGNLRTLPLDNPWVIMHTYSHGNWRYTSDVMYWVHCMRISKAINLVSTIMSKFYSAMRASQLTLSTINDFLTDERFQAIY
jgi:hypothetical protein